MAENVKRELRTNANIKIDADACLGPILVDWKDVDFEATRECISLR